ncbi:phosphoribosylaminoimidazolesuccinocarboxamide synthase [Alphaproteobacteria bacterium HT1-32]|nr:phosphoribosylaminoimidazolesuccinocarboxamide synthase [Alphaproteobacteria bacterium HT1-32]
MTETDNDTLLANRLDDGFFPELPNHYRGKVRDAYDLPDGRRVMIATDRQSAFDVVLASVPLKGQVLTQTAKFWFEQTEDICPNHVISFPDPNVTVAKRLDMLPIEIVVRDYLTGSTDTSVWKMYEAGKRTVYGHSVPDGLRKNDKLPATIITPTTKAEVGGHDAPITADEIISSGIMSAERWDELSRISLALFARGREVAAKHGLILVDTKYEFGVDETGAFILADEAHTPDSSRYWKAGSYESRHAAGEEPDSLDKEFLRLWISQRCDPYTEPVPEIPGPTLIEFSSRYVTLYETVTGLPFSPGDIRTPVRDRIRAALAREFPEYF